MRLKSTSIFGQLSFASPLAARRAIADEIRPRLLTDAGFYETELHSQIARDIRAAIMAVA